MRPRAVVLALGLLATAGCSVPPSEEDGLPGPGELLASVRAGVTGSARTQAPPQITRARLAELGITERFLLVRLETGAEAGLVPIAANRGRFVWSSEDDVTLTGRGGIIVATRGLGGDLLSAESDSLLQALAQGRSAAYRRTLRRLDGLGQILVQPHDCRLTIGPRETVVVLGRAHDTLRSTERCEPLAGSPAGTPPEFGPEPFVNTYNVGDGTIWVSRQYVGPAAGYLSLERVLE